jgi:hypothetical protein
MSIKVHIERLILDRIPDHEPGKVGRSIEVELARLLRRGGLSHELLQGGAMPDVTATTIRVSRDRNAQRFGAQVAGSIYRGIGARS